MRNSHLASLGLALASLASCQQGATVTVEQVGGVVTMVVTQYNDPKPACISDLSVYRAREDGTAMATPVWHVLGDLRAPCTSRFELGRVPAGFAADTGMTAPTLAVGQRYIVTAGGRGFMGDGEFVAR